MTRTSTKATDPTVIEPTPGENWGVTIDDSATNDAAETATERLARLLTEAASDSRAHVRVSKVDPESGKLKWCKNYPVADFDGSNFELIRRDWGPGSYEIRLYGIAPGGRFGVLAKPTIDIEAPITPIAAASTPAVNPYADALTPILKSIADGQAAIIQALNNRPDPAAQMSSTIGLLAQMREVFAPPQAPAPPASGGSLLETLQAMRLLKEVASEINPPATPPDNPLALAGGLMDLVKLHMQSRATESVPIVAVPESLSAIPRPNPAPPVAPASPTPAPITPPSIPEAAQSTEETPEMQLHRLLGALLKIAESRDPTFPDASIKAGAEFVYEHLPDEAIELLSIPVWFDVLSQFDARVTPHKEWLTKVRDKALAMFDEADSMIPELERGDTPPAG